VLTGLLNQKLKKAGIDLRCIIISRRSKKNIIMNIIPVVKCKDISASVRFYTELIDFELLYPGDEFPYRILSREGARLDLSSGSGDGVEGSCVIIEVADVDKVFENLIARGLDVSDKTGVHRRPIDQTWGMREFYVEDLDGNTLRFAQEIEGEKE
jgi:catechol 2,3-dioxygenase-like lactoylglutathione lyase family enzyme